MESVLVLDVPTGMALLIVRMGTPHHAAATAKLATGNDLTVVLG
jgi:hypothetical protein